jgi:hypothetical protein
MRATASSGGNKLHSVEENKKEKFVFKWQPGDSRSLGVVSIPLHCF